MSSDTLPQNSSLEITIRAIREILSMYPEFNVELVIANLTSEWNAAPDEIQRDWLCSDLLEKFCDYSYVHNAYCRCLRQAVRNV